MIPIAEKTNRIYFLAVCGTAMATLAALLKAKGYTVSGVDQNVYPPMSTFLTESGIKVHSGYDIKHLQPAPDLVVVGNAISRGNVEIESVLNRHIPYISMPDAIREFLIRGRRSIVIAGTHGKTSTTALLAWIFHRAGRHPGFLAGGLTHNFSRGGAVGEGSDFIIEGDEYDSGFFDKTPKFLHYLPDIGVINCIEYDHADIYSSLDEIKTAFRRFVNLIPSKGSLIVGAESPAALEVSGNAFCPVQTFGLTPDADWHACGARYSSGGMDFQVRFRDQSLGNLFAPLYGEHNIRNILAAVAVSRNAGIDFEAIRSACRTFRGVKRRGERVATIGGAELYDDFGHHPTAIRATLAAFRNRFPERRIWALFEPRTASTRRDVFQKSLAHSFDDADIVIVAPVYRAETIPRTERFCSETLVNDLRHRGVEAHYLPDVDEIVRYIKTHLQNDDLIITFSNGSFGNIHHKLITEYA